ncbi:MAG: GTPase Era [Actinomycetota bacterium]
MSGEPAPEGAPGPEPFRSGFATLVGRPNAGKSTLLNAILGTKVSIVSDKPQTTRTQVRGVLDSPSSQVVFVDTPGIHKPKTAAGERFNATARQALDEVDVVCFVLDATKPLGRGDRFVADRLPRASTICVVTKIDAAPRREVLEQLRRASELEFSEYYPVSGTTGAGTSELVAAVVERLPEGPRYYPEGTVTDVPDAFWVAELVREQLLAVARQELPHSIACRVTEWDWPHVKVEVLVERESQKGIVIGKGGEVLKRVGTAVRAQLVDGAFLELVVKVEPDWQRRPHSLDRLGL